MLRFKSQQEADRALRGEAPKVGKYRAQPVEIDGIRFASRLEARRYTQLKAMRIAGEIDYFLMQVPFVIDGGKYRLDFMTVKDGRIVAYEETKGIDTPLGKLKIRAVEKAYGIRITLIRKAA